MSEHHSKTPYQATTADANAVQIDVGKFGKTSFVAFLHYTLRLVGAVPKRDSPSSVEEIQHDLGVCMRSIIAALNDEQNRWCTEIICKGLEIYCKGEPETNRRAALVRAINTGLILLQPLAIGNSRVAVKPESDDFVFFMTQSRLKNADSDGADLDSAPDISCARRKDIIEAYSMDHDPRNVDLGQMLENLASQSTPHVLLEWKHYHSCWESIRSPNPLTIMRPAGYEHAGYVAAPLKEYRHTVNHSPPPPPPSRYDRNERWKIHSNASNDPAPPDDVTVHPINTQWCIEDAELVFYDTVGRDHILNVTIEDNLMRVWYFDHESPIQTSAFNFIEDLPFFFLFLFALQRFSPADWGYIDELSGVNGKISKPINLSEDSDETRSPTTFRRLDNEYQASHHLYLRGRATHVIYGKFASDGNDVSSILKLSWRQKIRLTEGTFIQEAGKRLRESKFVDVCDYLPTLLADRDFPQFSTDNIRKSLMIPIDDEATRLPYFLVLPRYEPITTRTTDWVAFFNDFAVLVCCHCILWHLGIQHRDISEKNLMWDPQTRKPKLCDFDLSHLSGMDDIESENRIGTLRFMALDLLDPYPVDDRLYRHDLESLFAVLVWTMLNYKDGVILDNQEVTNWKVSTPMESRIARDRTYLRLARMTPFPYVPRALWVAASRAAMKWSEIVQRSTSLIDRRDAYKYAVWCDDDHRERRKPSKEQELELEYLESIAVIEDFLPFFHDRFDFERTEDTKNIMEEVTKIFPPRAESPGEE